MPYLVLARKLRPERFDDLIGQENIAKTLKNAIRLNRVAHAFLFTGTRGVGKTTCARILTKALNCLALQDFEPCNECINCNEIAKNTALDVIEIDAASNRGIEHIRELKENINFTTAKSRYKVYIIDEVHMLTIEAFNALLKTLEEPPEHIKFILATTDPHKLPATIISRCQRFDFQPIAIAQIKQFLFEIAKKEAVQVDDIILKQIAKNAEGSMRDALTALEMLISLSGKQISMDDALSIIGINHNNEVVKLYKAIIENNIESAFDTVQKMLDYGITLHQIILQLFKIIQNISLAKATVHQSDAFWKDHFAEEVEEYKQLAEHLTHSILQQQFQVILDLEQQIKKSRYALACFQMAIIRLSKIENLINVKQIVDCLKQLDQNGLEQLNAQGSSTNHHQKSAQTQEKIVPVEQQQTITPNQKEQEDTAPKKQQDTQNQQSEQFDHLTNNSAAFDQPSDYSDQKMRLDTNHEAINNEQSVLFDQEAKNAPQESVETKIDTIENETKNTDIERAPLNTTTIDTQIKTPSIDNWLWFTEQIKDDCSPILRSMINNAQLVQFDERVLIITSESGAISKLLNKETMLQIEQLLKKYFQYDIKLEIDDSKETRHQSNHQINLQNKEKARTAQEEAILNTPVVKEILEIDGMKVKQFNLKEQENG